MEDEEPEKTYPLSPSKMSKTPSWVMLGFLLGAAFVWAFKRDVAKPAGPSPVALAEWPKAVTVPPSPLTTIEGVFAEWKDNAVWENNLTEVALWRSETRAYSEFYEVRRVGEALYFRSIPRLTHLIVRSGTPLPNDAPLQFTESEKHYREWVEQGRAKSEDPSRPVPAAPRFAPPTPPKVDATVPPLEKPAVEPPPKT